MVAVMYLAVCKSVSELFSHKLTGLGFGAYEKKQNKHFKRLICEVLPFSHCLSSDTWSVRAKLSHIKPLCSLLLFPDWPMSPLTWPSRSSLLRALSLSPFLHPSLLPCLHFWESLLPAHRDKHWNQWLFKGRCHVSFALLSPKPSPVPGTD